MTRSIHETRRALEEARKWDFADDRRREQDVWLVDVRLDQKRLYKQRIRASRPPIPDLGVPLATEITAEPLSAFMHHPLTADDVQGLLAVAPGDIRPDLGAIRLRAGLLEDDMASKDTEADPLTGRHGFDLGGGIWGPRLRGRYRLNPVEVDLFAYVYDPAALRVPEVQHTLLWLQQASTLMHELAHAWDDVKRSARDRWGLDQEYRAEEFARETARRWTATAATNYFEQEYPERANAFHSWIASAAGIPISLARVAEDLDRLMWGVAIGLFEICASWGDKDPLDLRVDLAEQFHFVDDYEPGRRILETVLALRPQHPAAVTLMGDIAVHEQDWNRALDLTASAVALSPQLVAAHRDRVDALVGAGRFVEAIEACNRALALVPNISDPDHGALRLERAYCEMQLGDLDAAGRDLDSLIAEGKPMTAQAAKAFKAELLIRAGRWSEARICALSELKEARPTWRRALLIAAAWESALELGIEESTFVPTTRDIERLEWNGRQAWADRLKAKGLRPRAPRRTRRDAELVRRQGALVRL